MKRDTFHLKKSPIFLLKWGILKNHFFFGIRNTALKKKQKLAILLHNIPVFSPYSILKYNKFSRVEYHFYHLKKCRIEKGWNLELQIFLPLPTSPFTAIHCDIYLLKYSQIIDLFLCLEDCCHVTPMNVNFQWYLSIIEGNHCLMSTWCCKSLQDVTRAQSQLRCTSISLYWRHELKRNKGNNLAFFLFGFTLGTRQLFQPGYSRFRIFQLEIRNINIISILQHVWQNYIQLCITYYIGTST